MSEDAPSGVLTLGTRKSALAIAQSEGVAAEIRRRWPSLTVELRGVVTTGDRVQARSLAEIGGKGLFVKEIEEAMLGGRIDAGVHSMKDLPAMLARGLAIAAVPARVDARDVLVARAPGGLRALPARARVGTGSLRRRAFLRQLRPDLEIVPFRGNLDTRIRKWRAGEVDALVLAAAGLRRLGVTLPEASPIDVADMLPAIGQGALAIETVSDGPWRGRLAALDHADTAAAVEAERAFLRGVGGDCTTPIAAHATVAAGELRLRAAIADPDGARIVRGERSGQRARGAEIGAALAEDVLARGGAQILAELAR